MKLGRSAARWLTAVAIVTVGGFLAVLISVFDAPDGSFCVQDLGGSVPPGMTLLRAERWAAVGDHTCLMKLVPATSSGLTELLRRLPPDDSRMPLVHCPAASGRAAWGSESQAPSVTELYAGSHDRPGGGSTDFWYICVDRTVDAVYVLTGNT